MADGGSEGPQLSRAEQAKIESKDNFKSPGKVSIVFRRHSVYTTRPGVTVLQSSLDPESKPVDMAGVARGFLSPEGYSKAQESAVQVANLIPDGAEVSLSSSPSFMPARDRFPIVSDRVIDPGLASPKIEPQRALFSMRLYGKEFYNRGLIPQEPSVSMSRDGSMEMAGVKKDRRLGDLLEDGNTNMAGFYQVLNDPDRGYGGMKPSFWQDYINETLKPDVRVALERANYWDSVQLAQNLTEVIAEDVDQETKAQKGTKKVDMNTTHGETQDALIHHLLGFLDVSGIDVPEETRQAFEKGMGYNEGINVHVDKADHQMVVELEDGQSINADLSSFQEYLARLRQDRNQKRTQGLGPLS